LKEERVGEEEKVLRESIVETFSEKEKWGKETCFIHEVGGHL